MVGGIIPRSMARIQNADSMAPAAPRVCPVIDLVELTAIRAACSPNTCLIACVSATSPCGVEVPWALMRQTRGERGFFVCVRELRERLTRGRAGARAQGDRAVQRAVLTRHVLWI